jgi:hypothetical protein
VFDILKEHSAIHAVYNSAERESEHASTCQEGTRKQVLSKLIGWSTANDGYPVCWLEGPAGSGKSTILHTIAKKCDDEKRLAFSFFFSRGKSDRSDTSKFIPTFAYQLARSFPAIQPSLLHVLLKDDPFAPHLRLRDQMEKLVLEPALVTHQQTVPSMVVIIDGLDECGDADLLRELIRALVDATHYLPFRFLFASRPESHIRQTFDSPLIKPKAEVLSLRDFQAHDDVRKYLQQQLMEIHRQNYNIMRDVRHPWPSPDQLTALIKKSEGLFIYVSTLVKFVGDGRGLPQEKLQSAVIAHHGVDPLYGEVLSKAQHLSTHFLQVVGTIIHLRHPLTIHDLEQLLQLSSNHIRQTLQGCQSILVVPDYDQEAVKPVLPYHASLKEFLSDANRAGIHFLNPKIYHATILVDCLWLIGLVHENQTGQQLEYACQQWCYHLFLAISYQVTAGGMNTHGNIEILMKKMSEEWLKTWMYGLKTQERLKSVYQDCELLMQKIMVRWIESNFLKHVLIHQLRDKKHGKSLQRA